MTGVQTCALPICLGCPASRGESIEEACEVHGVDCDELLEKLNAHLASKKS